MLYEEQYGQERFLNLIRASTGNYQFWWNSIGIEMLIHIWIALLIAASVCNDWTYSTVLVWLIIVVFMLWLYVFILYCKLKVMFCWILRLFILLLGVYNSLVVLHCRSTFCDIKMCDWYRFIFQLPPNCLGEYFIFLSKYRTVLCKFLPKVIYSHDLS